MEWHRVIVRSFEGRAMASESNLEVTLNHSIDFVDFPTGRELCRRDVILDRGRVVPRGSESGSPCQAAPARHE